MLTLSLTFGTWSRSASYGSRSMTWIFFDPPGFDVCCNAILGYTVSCYKTFFLIIMIEEKIFPDKKRCNWSMTGDNRDIRKLWLLLQSALVNHIDYCIILFLTWPTLTHYAYSFWDSVKVLHSSNSEQCVGRFLFQFSKQDMILVSMFLLLMWLFWKFWQRL